MANKVTLQSLEGLHPIDENLRPLKIGGLSTSLELATEGARVMGDLEVTGNIKGNVKDVELDLTKIISTDLVIDDSGDITLDAAGGDINLTSADVNISATKKLYLDGGNNSYIEETSSDVVDFFVGGDNVLRLTESGSLGNLVNFGTSAAGFTAFSATYNATDTNVVFASNGQKAELIFGSGNITDLNLLFPDVSCNCVLKITQDGTGSRTITNYKTFDQAGGNESTLFFPNGGTSPTLSTGGNAVDILSIYWDNGRHTAYGIMSLDFQASS